MFTKVSLGCWVDGDARGRHAGEHAQAIAVSYGWDGETVDVDHPDYDEVTDEATDYLNSLCDSQTYFTWEDGSLYHFEIGVY